MRELYISPMAGTFRLNQDYRIAGCCNPSPGDEIVGFLKQDRDHISVHKIDCPGLNSIQPDRLVTLTWNEIIENKNDVDPTDDPAFKALDDIDFTILKHHEIMGVDYAAVVAKHTGIDRATVFERHRKLRDLKLLVRVQPRMIRYRKNIVDNKWIKHRNHTYYEITKKGQELLSFYESNDMVM